MCLYRVSRGKTETRALVVPQEVQETEEKMEYQGLKVHQAQRSVEKIYYNWLIIRSGQL